MNGRDKTDTYSRPEYVMHGRRVHWNVNDYRNAKNLHVKKQVFDLYNYMKTTVLLLCSICFSSWIVCSDETSPTIKSLSLETMTKDSESS